MEYAVDQTQNVDHQSADRTETIWTEFHHRLLSFIRFRVDSVQDAEDILQEVFARIHTNRHQLGELASVSGWVYRITRNAIIDYQRARSRSATAMKRLANETAITSDAATSQPVDTNGRDANSNDDLANCMRPLMETLPEHYREAVALTELGGVSQKEAAEALGVSISGMKSRVQRGREKLKKALFECCTFALDGRNGVIGAKPNNPDGCSICDCDPVDSIPK